MDTADAETNMLGCNCCSKARTADPPRTNTSNLWQTMVKTVRDADTRKVADAKEDLDTLLVFAGLFSAVVTTFVVDSYASLQPDNTDELVFLMRQSLSQNYTFADGVLRPAVPFPNDTPFAAPLWALRVNGLWFASLVVSLSTASFGMLVKQWLNEYLAMDWITPEEQLRARQFRYPGLEDWKVFEIAAMLPLLLHVSLGFFFIGLCFYTAAANETIGQSTFPLVAGWAFFALASIVAPLASPRCPYRITLLKSALRIGRRYVTTVARRLIHVVASTIWVVVKGAARGAVRGMHMLSFALSWGLDAFWDFVDGTPESLPSAICQTVLSILVLVAFALLYALYIALYVPLLIVGVICVVLSDLAQYAFKVLQPPLESIPKEEDEVMRQPYIIHSLLSSVDKLIINDGPVLETMAEVLIQTHTPPSSIIAFALGCIRNRIGAANAVLWIPHTTEAVKRKLNLRMLSDNAHNLVLRLVTNSIESIMPYTLSPLASEPPDIWMSNAAVILLTPPDRPLPEFVTALVRDPTTLATLLHLARPVIKDWPLSDILDVIWASFGLSSGALDDETLRTWDRVPRLTSPTLSEFQEAVAQILLESTWLRGYEQPLSAAEAPLMLLALLNGGGEKYNIIGNRTDRSLPESYLEGRRIDLAGALTSLFPEDYAGVASPLAAAVIKSPSLIPCGLRLYSAILTNHVSAHDPVWETLSSMGDIEFHSAALRPVLADIWQFLLLCARGAAAIDGGKHVRTFDFVCTCLSLVRARHPFMPWIWGFPREDWADMLPVLVQFADERQLDEDVRTAVRSQQRSAAEDAIPALAARALQLRDPVRTMPPTVSELVEDVSWVYASRPS
ncbi:hypothetical protein PsYK624_115660 [Phanerochaete sordida]|uniref:DUF6535 domain-containing protein n=1 Tax=Phanerochaete sordida TaxID=48140 RepID=A0A9P3LIP4_9APHY|nr:hypothetical protein PsYK624_115660 [Phanerochaete sordida]